VGNNNLLEEVFSESYELSLYLFMVYLTKLLTASRRRVGSGGRQEKIKKKELEEK
jgi:hypothetical protein